MFERGNLHVNIWYVSFCYFLRPMSPLHVYLKG